MNFGMNNFGQDGGMFPATDPNSLAAMINPVPEQNMLGKVPGLGNQPGMGLDLSKGPTAEAGSALDRYAAGTGGGGEMATIMGMNALKQLSSASRGGGGQGGGLSAQAPVAPRGNQVQITTPQAPAPIDPRMYMMMMGKGAQ